jgi:histidine triad (HIT) family protein
MSSDCVFCRIVDGEEPATIVWQDDRSLVIVPLNPVANGHVIALPRQHATDFTDRWLETANAMYAAFQYASGIGDDFNIITSKGRAATQSVFHLHVHVVPRREGDGLALPWCSGRCLCR